MISAPRRGLPALAAGLGVLAAFGLAPYGWWLLTLAVFAALPWVLRHVASARVWGWIGWAFGTGYFAHALIWIVEPFLVDPDRHGWMAPFALVFLAGGLALFWALAFWAAARFARSGGSRIALLIVTLSLAEFARAYVLTGFPWGGLAQIWVGTDAAQLLALFGPHGLAMVTLAVTLLPGQAALSSTVPLLHRLASFLPVLIFAGVSIVIGRALPTEQPTSGTIRLVQPNAPQDQKWDPAMIPVFFERLIEFTSQTPHPDLIVWPESAVPNFLHDAAPAFEAITEAAQGSAVEGEVCVIDVFRQDARIVGQEVCRQIGLPGVQRGVGGRR